MICNFLCLHFTHIVAFIDYDKNKYLMKEYVDYKIYDK